MNKPFAEMTDEEIIASTRFACCSYRDLEYARSHQQGQQMLRIAKDLTDELALCALRTFNDMLALKERKREEAIAKFANFMV